jgi:hypothetical protein
MTSDQLDPFAQAPWTRTTVGASAAQPAELTVAALTAAAAMARFKDMAGLLF